MAFQTLLHRALALAQAEVPTLENVKVGQHGCLDYSNDAETKTTVEAANIGEIVLVGSLIDLLCVFLGDALALRLIQDVWPGVSLGGPENLKDAKS